MKCEFCGCDCVEGESFNALKLAQVVGIRDKEDSSQFAICEECYNHVESALATTWLSKIRRK